MNVSSTLFIVYRRNPDFSKNDRPIGGESTRDESQILDGEIREFVVRKASCTGPHLGFVQIPVFTRLDDLEFDLVKYIAKRFLCELSWMMRLVKGHFFFGCFVARTISQLFCATARRA